MIQNRTTPTTQRLPIPDRGNTDSENCNKFIKLLSVKWIVL